jgi:hypothetical protein
MAFIPEYEYDIFISYAHVDNATFPGQTEGWIKQFYQSLNLMLAKRFGRMDMVKIWWDSNKLDGSVLFDDSIAEGIKRSAIMICLNSPGYIQSDYCRQELELFHDKAEKEEIGLSIGHRSRIINVLLNNVPFTDWPEKLSGTSGFPFHDAETNDDFGETIETTSDTFKKQMHQLRDAIWNLLTDFEAKTNPTVDTANNTDADDSKGFTIFLGEVADTLRSPRKRIITELKKKNFNVITDIPPPLEVSAHEMKAKEAVKSSQLAIHLLDEYPGREISGAPELWYPQEQARITMASDIPKMIWMPSTTDISSVEEEMYQKFLEDVEAGNASPNDYEFIRSTKSTVAQEIINFAEQLQASKAKANSSDDKLSVLLDTHFNDQVYALDLSRTLLENEIQPFINPQEDDPRKNINLLGDRIRQVRKLIFLYGNVSKEWVLERMSAALQLIITNDYPIEDFFVFMAPPHKQVSDISINQRFLKVNVVDGSHGLLQDKNELNKFLVDLKSGNE